ncbi:MAG: hypothetical protein HYY97_01420 [Rhodocyclales bacterium]|nr:hypothetical protein [Rhodocyclales bacterium]
MTDAQAVDCKWDMAGGRVVAAAVGGARYFAGDAKNCMAVDPQVCFHENMSREFSDT